MFKLPTDGQRAFVCGQTGSGKTRAGIWQLSMRSYTRIPWIIFDYKGDDLIARIEHVKEVSILSKPPTHPGLYIVRPLPHQHEEVQAFLWKVWANKNTGLFFDEGYMVSGQGKKCPPLDAILTQGRSLRVPCITLCQRPVWLNRFVISETDVYQVFHLNSEGDREKVGEFIPAECDAELPRFWSHWYDVAQREHTVLQPVPLDAEILSRFHDRLKPRRRLL